MSEPTMMEQNEDYCRRMLAEAEVASLKAENERLTAELALWKPMTPAEAQAACDAAEAVPVSEEEIERMVAFATDPANRLNNEEEAQLHVRYRKVCAANADLRATVAAREATIAELVVALEAIFEAKEYNDERWVGKLYDAGQKAKAVLAAAGRRPRCCGHDMVGGGVDIEATVQRFICSGCNATIIAPISDAGSSLLAERDALRELLLRWLRAAVDYLGYNGGEALVVSTRELLANFVRKDGS